VLGGLTLGYFAFFKKHERNVSGYPHPLKTKLLKSISCWW